MSIEQEQEPAHRIRPPCEPAVCMLVTLKLSLLQRVGQCYRLTKAQAKSFPGNCVNTSGRVPCQCEIPPANLTQSARHRHGASFRTAWFRMAQRIGYLGKVLPGLLTTHSRI